MSNEQGRRRLKRVTEPEPDQEEEVGPPTEPVEYSEEAEGSATLTGIKFRARGPDAIGRVSRLMPRAAALVLVVMAPLLLVSGGGGPVAITGSALCLVMAAILWWINRPRRGPNGSDG